MWRLCYIIIVIYAFVPLRIFVGIIVGLMLPTAHILVSIFVAKGYEWLLWRQVGDKVIFCMMLKQFCSNMHKEISFFHEPHMPKTSKPKSTQLQIKSQ